MHSHTQKAILVSDDGNDDNAVWLPVSQIQTRQKGGEPHSRFADAHLQVRRNRRWTFWSI